MKIGFISFRPFLGQRVRDKVTGMWSVPIDSNAGKSGHPAKPYSFKLKLRKGEIVKIKQTRDSCENEKYKVQLHKFAVACSEVCEKGENGAGRE